VARVFGSFTEMEGQTGTAATTCLALLLTRTFKIAVLGMHLLGSTPSGEAYEAPGTWFKSAFIWSWTAQRCEQDAHGPSTHVHNLTMIAFRPRVSLIERFLSYLDDPSASRIFESMLQDPYMLVDFALGTWYTCIEQSAMEMTHRVRYIEEARKLATTSAPTLLEVFETFSSFLTRLCSRNHSMRLGEYSRDRPPHRFQTWISQFTRTPFLRMLSSSLSRSKHQWESLSLCN